MSERKLATIQKILKLEPIVGADNIEKATILGWELVVAKKDNFKVGDLVVYIEIDSILPERPEFEFLRERKFRIRTIKLRKQISQGIAFQLQDVGLQPIYNEGDDVTEILGIKKYDPQLQEENTQKERTPKNPIDKFLMRYSLYRKIFSNKQKASWPSFITKTDEDRIQLFPHICENEKDTIFQVSEKCDGSSATYFLIRNKKWWQFWNKYIFGVCSRNIWKKTDDNSSYWQIAKKYDIKNNLIGRYENINQELAIQGEICGPGIQKNKYNLKEIDFYVFNIISLKTNKKYSNESIKNICDNLQLKHVPFINNTFLLKSTIPAMVEYAKGKSLINPEVLREGIVVRNYEKNISFKVINPEFLLKHGE